MNKGRIRVDCQSMMEVILAGFSLSTKMFSGYRSMCHRTGIEVSFTGPWAQRIGRVDAILSMNVLYSVTDWFSLKVLSWDWISSGEFAIRAFSF